MPKQSTGRYKKRNFRSEYSALINAKARCTNPKHPQFKDYGGRGIYVDPAFLEPATGFDAFMDAIGPKPSPELTLDRVRNSEGYVPGNLAWTDRKTQQKNRRPRAGTVTDLGWGIGFVETRGRNNSTRFQRSPYIEHDGRKQTLVEWARELGVNNTTLRQRFQRGLTPEQALVSELYKPALGKLEFR